MKVEIWSDVVCPFCYIGKRKFEMALDEFAAKDNVEIVWRSFQLDPAMAPVKGESIHQYLAKRKGVTTEEGKKMNDRMATIAKEVGLAYAFDKTIPANTLLAHRLLHLAKGKGVQNQMKERLFVAYYTEGKDINDISTLVQLATELGLLANQVNYVLMSDHYTEEVQLDLYEARQIGVQGVPFFVFNDKYAVSGAQQPELFKEVLEKLWQEEKPLLANKDESGFCTVDGICN